MIGLMLDLLVMVGLLVVVSVCDDPLVVDWLSSRHSVLGYLSLWTVPCWVHAVFAVKQAIESSQLLCPSLASSSCAVATPIDDCDCLCRSLTMPGGS
jgi:hypothetical protein